METFKASDGVQLAYYVDNFTEPWKSAPILLLLHAAMGSARRYYAWVPPLSRYEVHLDRKLERMLTMLLRLQALRRSKELG